MKPVMVAKLAMQCSDLYADAVKLLQLESIKSLWPKVSDVPVILHMMTRKDYHNGEAVKQNHAFL